MVNIRNATKLFLAAPNHEDTGDPASSTPTDSDKPTDPQVTTVEFSTEQWTELCDTLNLDKSEATAETILTAITTLADTTKTVVEEGKKISAKAANTPTGPAPTIIDADTWQAMQDTLKIGLRAQNQQKRVAAEQIVDEAIRLGKARPTQRESLIQAYNVNPEAAMRKMQNGKEAGHFEIGHSLEPDYDATPTGWVR